MLRHSLLVTLLLLTGPAITVAQKLAIEEYRVRVITKDGSRIRGTLDEVSNTYVAVGDSDSEVS